MVWIDFRSSNLTRQLLADPRPTIRPWRSPYLGWRASPNALIRTHRAQAIVRFPTACSFPISCSFVPSLASSHHKSHSPTTVRRMPHYFDHSCHGCAHTIVDRLGRRCRTLVPPGAAGADDTPANRSPAGDRPRGPRRDPLQARPALKGERIAFGGRAWRVCLLGESRRVGHPAALLRRRSSGATGLIAGATGDWFGAISRIP